MRNSAAKKPAPGILFLIVSRHADGKCFQKLKHPAVENYMYSHNVALSLHSFIHSKICSTVSNKTIVSEVA